MRGVDLTATTRDLLPPVCRSCTWWQKDERQPHGDGTRSAWEQTLEGETGLFGRALVDGDAVVGWMQAAPSGFVPRARRLPAGPPSPDAWLLTCAYLYDQDYLGGFQQLLLELEAALKNRRVAALEAFVLRRTRPSDPFRGYLRELNLFHPGVLEGGGFRPVCLCGEIGRYRLDLAAVIVAARSSRAVEVELGAATQPV